MRFDKELLKTPEFARIHAHISGDGYILQTRSKRTEKEQKDHPRANIYRNRYHVRYVNMDPVLVNQFIWDVKKLFNRKVIAIRKYEYDVCGKWIYDLIREHGAIKSCQWFIPSIILNASKEIKKEWLKAFFDDEAGVGKSYISLKIINKNGIKQIQLLLKDFNITTSKCRERIPKNPRHQKTYEIRLRKSETILYNNYIGFDSPKKKEKLKKLIKKWGRWDARRH